MEQNEATVLKSGEIRIQTTISRSTDGLLVNVWAQAQVEDFIRSLGSGELIDVQTIGRHWNRPMKRDENSGKLQPDDRRLYVYDMTQKLGALVGADGVYYNLSHPGSPLIGGDGKNDYNETLNLSFLRLVGISEAGGVSFVIRGVYSRENITKLASQIERTTNRFYREFLRPFKLIVTVSTMPVEGL